MSAATPSACATGHPRSGRQGSGTGASMPRGTFAAWSIRAGVQLYLSRIMGTSVEMIWQTYGHLVPDAEEYPRGLLD
jgi:hypothetical protein